jgi:hypothetical protein
VAKTTWKIHDQIRELPMCLATQILSASWKINIYNLVEIKALSVPTNGALNNLESSRRLHYTLDSCKRFVFLLSSVLNSIRGTKFLRKKIEKKLLSGRKKCIETKGNNNTRTLYAWILPRILHVHAMWHFLLSQNQFNFMKRNDNASTYINMFLSLWWSDSYRMRP